MTALPAFDLFEPERVLVVGPPPGLDGLLAPRIRARNPQATVASAGSYLSAIAELCARPARAVVAGVDPACRHLESAVAGLREAAGPGATLVLCCTPDAEPLARRAAECGADDYVLYPPRDEDLDALFRPGFMPDAPCDGSEAGISMEELARLAALPSAITDKPMELLEQAASLVRLALDAPGAMIVVDGAAATSGERVLRPVLTAALPGEAGIRGQLAVNERPGRPYEVNEAQKLSQYARLMAGLATLASRQRQWRRLALTDECSGVPNRRYLEQQLRAILARATVERFPVTVLFFDLDDFKSYNDRFGHDAGDEIIRVISRLFRENCREQDVVARYGGDEFAVVFWDPEGPRAAGSKHPDCALTVLERIKAALKTQQLPQLAAAGQGALTISGGLATFPWDGATAEALLQRADQALLAAKRAGKNQVYLIGDAR